DRALLDWLVAVDDRRPYSYERQRPTLFLLSHVFNISKKEEWNGRAGERCQGLSLVEPTSRATRPGNPAKLGWQSVAGPFRTG
ncbi:MAG: hypothetical protein NZ658_07595, partial [Pirellulales bacterium]|nr:hypothetical protein [Pirellulales bacterium]